MVLPARSGRAPSMCGASASGAFACDMIFSGLVLTKPIAKPGRAGLAMGHQPFGRMVHRPTINPQTLSHPSVKLLPFLGSLAARFIVFDGCRDAPSIFDGHPRPCCTDRLVGQLVLRVGWGRTASLL